MFAKKFFFKTSSSFQRLARAIAWLPRRLARLARHLWAGIAVFSKKTGKARVRSWWEDLSFLLFDLMAMPEVYESVLEWTKWQTRPLSPQEMATARSVFGDAIPLHRVRVDETAALACKRHHIIYVSYYTINAWGRFRPDLLIHELMHVWQYQQLGGAYIPRALRAQASQAGYNYGGVGALQLCLEQGRGLDAFNLEQQADIIADFFCIREGRPPSWGSAGATDLPVYQAFVNEIQNRV